MGKDYHRPAVVAAFGVVFLITSQDAASYDHPQNGRNSGSKPVCSGEPAKVAIPRMAAIQSLRETQVEVEMMKHHQAASPKH